MGLGDDPSAPSYPVAAVSGPTPSYPSLAAKERLQGTVVLAVTIDAGGHAAEIAFVQRSISDVLDNEAMRTARQWRYQAGMVEGKAVGGVVKLQIGFAVGKTPMMKVVP